MIIESQGFHTEKEDGELFIGLFTGLHIENFVVWETARAGDLVEKGEYRGKYPLFVQRSEVINKGWKTH